MAGSETGEFGGPYARQASAPAGEAGVMERLARDLGPGPFALVLLFVSPTADLARLPAQAARAFPGATVVGCTTAGEISAAGYDEGMIVALALTAAHFAAETVVIEDLAHLDRGDLVAALIRAREGLANAHPQFPEEFALLLVDGLSVMEDELAATLAAGLGPAALIGGSAGDGTRFGETLVLAGARLRRNAAVVSLVRSACPVRVFSVDHLAPTEKRMVVTRADPRQRLVSRINAEPAAWEYARLLGRDPLQLTPFTFAAHPVVVRMGARHHVRAIQQVAPNGDLIFFAAIDEGVVLTLAEPRDMAAHLAGELARLSEPGPPAAILAFDCILRRLEAQEKQMIGAVSELLRRHEVVGFSTYGEQRGPLHVNHTMTGMAIYPPGARLSTRAGG